MQLSSHRICLCNYQDFIIFILYFCSILVFFFIYVEYSSVYIKMIKLSLLILAQSNICWERKPNVKGFNVYAVNCI